MPWPWRIGYLSFLRLLLGWLFSNIQYRTNLLFALLGNAPVCVHFSKRASFQPPIDERQIQELRSLRFIHEASNVVFLGPPGVGKESVKRIHERPSKLVNAVYVGRRLSIGLLLAPILLLACLCPRLIVLFRTEMLFLLMAYCISYLSFGMMFDVITRYREEYVVETARAESLVILDLRWIPAEVRAAVYATFVYCILFLGGPSRAFIYFQF